MIKLISKNGKVYLSTNTECPQIGALNNDELETLQYAVYNFNYVNNNTGVNWEVTINEWIINISDVFNLDMPHVKRVIQVLNKLL